LSLILLGAPAAEAQVAAQAKFATQTSAKPVPGNALALSSLLNPRDKMLEVGMKAFQTGIDSALKKSPEDAAIYDENPGLLDAVIAAGQPVMRRHMEATIPVQQRRFAQFYAEKFSPDEIDQLIAFYSTRTGTKVIAAMYSGIDLEKLAAAMDDKGNVTLTANQVRDASGAAASHATDDFDAEDWRAVFTFLGTPVHLKLARLAPEFNQVVADVGNEPDPELDAEIEKAVGDAVKTYLEKKPAKPSS